MRKSRGELWGLYTPIVRSMTKQKKVEEGNRTISNTMEYSGKNILESNG